MQIEFPSFTPHRLCRNSHLQTVIPLWLPTKYRPPIGDSIRIQTQDHDAIASRENAPENWKAGDRIVVIVHGLCGSHSSQYMMRVSAKLFECGFKTIRVDMRGFGDSEKISRGHMHAGRSEDVASVLGDVSNRFPGSPITLIGFSLGGNIALKYLCEIAETSPNKLDSAVAVSPPIDLLKCTLNLRKGLNRFYDSYFAKLLSKTVTQRRKSGVPFDDIPLSNFPKRLYDFDDQYTAPASGFANAEDYYQKCSTHLIVDRVAIPTLLLVAKDDPIVPFEMYEHIQSPFIKKLVSNGGGHLGFIAKKSGDPDRRWMDWRIVEWVNEVESVRQKSAEPIEA